MSSPIQANSRNIVNHQEVSQRSSSWRLPSLTEGLKSAAKIAPLAIAVFAASSAQTADGGPILEMFCIAGCYAIIAANPVVGLAWFPTCMTICTATGFLPTP